MMMRGSRVCVCMAPRAGYKHTRDVRVCEPPGGVVCAPPAGLANLANLAITLGLPPELDNISVWEWSLNYLTGVLWNRAAGGDLVALLRAPMALPRPIDRRWKEAEELQKAVGLQHHRHGFHSRVEWRRARQ